MNREELKFKLERGESLKPMELAMLDAFLDEDKDGEIANSINSLVNEEPSLTWRSRLNEQLYAISVAKKPRFTIFTLPRVASATALLGAATFGFMLMSTKKPVVPTQEPSLSESLVKWHQEVSASMILPGDGTSVEDFFSIKEFKPSETDKLLYDGQEISRL